MQNLNNNTKNAISSAYRKAFNAIQTYIAKGNTVGGFNLTRNKQDQFIELNEKSLGNSQDHINQITKKLDAMLAISNSNTKIDDKYNKFQDLIDIAGSPSSIDEIVKISATGYNNKLINTAAIIAYREITALRELEELHEFEIIPKAESEEFEIIPKVESEAFEIIGATAEIPIIHVQEKTLLELNDEPTKRQFGKFNSEISLNKTGKTQPIRHSSYCEADITPQLLKASDTTSLISASQLQGQFQEKLKLQKK